MSKYYCVVANTSFLIYNVENKREAIKKLMDYFEKDDNRNPIFSNIHIDKINEEVF